jgi:hypothetical protein
MRKRKQGKLHIVRPFEPGKAKPRVTFCGESAYRVRIAYDFKEATCKTCLRIQESLEDRTT